MELLQLRGLEVGYEEEEGMTTAVDGIDLSVGAEEKVGIVGESGCGKSTVIKSIIDILDSNGRILDGNIYFKGDDIAQLSREEMNARIRWQEISYIPQNAMAALDPVHRLGAQIVEVIEHHTDQSKRDARRRAEQLLGQVGLDSDRMHDYPHELSGGQRQRGVIALALALEPSLILADEPTTGLDVVIQDEILALLDDIQRDLECGIVFVTHDMSVIAEVADTTAVMYGGRVMEVGPTADVLTKSAHPYTIGLKNAFPTLARARDRQRLISIPGAPPDLKSPPTGCRFKARCPFATEECDVEEPPTVEVGEGQRAKCHYTEQAAEFRERGRSPSLWLGEEGS